MSRLLAHQVDAERLYVFAQLGHMPGVRPSESQANAVRACSGSALVKARLVALDIQQHLSDSDLGDDPCCWLLGVLRGRVGVVSRASWEVVRKQRESVAGRMFGRTSPA